MLTKNIRNKIELEFYNQNINMKRYNEQRQDILDSGLTASIGFMGSRNGHSSPTETKAMKLENIDRALDNRKNWFTVVRNTFLTFRFLPEHDIMVALYIDGMSKSKVINKYFAHGLWERTFFRWREKWLETAYNWAKELDLL